MAKTNDTNPKSRKSPRPVMLKEVSITAKKPVVKEQTIRLYPRGEVRKSQMDSLSKNNPKLAKVIGAPIAKSGQKAQYGTNSSDLIKQATKKRK